MSLPDGLNLPEPKRPPFQSRGNETFARAQKRIQAKRRLRRWYHKRKLSMLGDCGPAGELVEEAYLHELKLEEMKGAPAVDFYFAAESNAKRVPRVDRNNSAN